MVPMVDGFNTDIGAAVGSAVIGMDASALIACTTVVAHKVCERVKSRRSSSKGKVTRCVE